MPRRCGLGDRLTAQRRGEICDLGIRLHLELLSYEFLVQASVFHRAGAVSGGGESTHELFRCASGKWIGVRKSA